VRSPAWVAAVAALALAGCGGGGTEDRAGLAAEERTWVRELVAWMQGVERAGARAEAIRSRILSGGSGSRRDFDEAAEPVRDCGARFERSPGDAPTKRLARVARLALEACEEFARGVRAESRAFTGNPGEALFTADEAFAKGNRLWLETEHEVELLATWNRPLPVRGGDRATSRVEPRFGRVAGRFANRPVEVRCWSRKDWPDVYGEWRTFANDRDLPAGFVSSFDRGRFSSLYVRDPDGHIVEIATRSPGLWPGRTSVP
jgi:hypothetical protein